MDRAHGWTDEQIEALERRISREYGQAAREMRALLEDRMARYASELEQRERALDDTPEARRAHREWLRRRAADREWVEGMVDSLEGSAMDAHGRAMGMVEDRLPRVYAENADWAAFEVDRAARVDTAFTLTDEDTVRQLMGRGELLFEPPRPDAAKVKAWTDRKLTSTITQGILRGESVPHVADRVAEVCGSGRAAAVRTARTACTGAENAGRVSSYQRARRLGIGLRQEWMATLDGRTRDSHRLLDGERTEVGERFSNGLRFPGDPQGTAAEVYNCRCTLVPAVDGVDQSAAARFSRLPEGMTYEDWKEQARRRTEARKGATEIVAAPPVTPVPAMTTSADSFVSVLDAAKASCPAENAWRVDTTRTAEDFNRDQVTMYVTPNGSTFALKDDGDIISVCKNQITDKGTNAKSLMAAAVENGGTHLDSFDGNYGFYVKCGFEPVSRCKFSKEFAPDGWIEGRDDEEDIYFMRYVGVGNVRLDTKEKAREAIPYSEGYDEAEAIIKKLLKEVNA